MEIKQIKYLGEQAVSYLVEKCKATFALINHKHTAEEVGADAAGSASAALALSNEYTDDKIEAVNATLSSLTTGDTVVKESEHSSTADTATNAENAENAENAINAEHAINADNATTAESATKDSDGNVIVDTYETKEDATAKLNEAKGYTDTEVTNLASKVAYIDENDNESIIISVDLEVLASLVGGDV